MDSMGTNIELLIKLEADLHHLAVRDIIKNISHTPPIQTSNDTTSHSNVSDVEPTYPAALVAELAQFKVCIANVAFSLFISFTPEELSAIGLQLLKRSFSPSYGSATSNKSPKNGFCGLSPLIRLG
jgi:hypothetical protein